MSHQIGHLSFSPSSVTYYSEMTYKKGNRIKYEFLFMMQKVKLNWNSTEAICLQKHEIKTVFFNPSF